MSEFKILTADDTYIALNELMRYELEEYYRERVLFPDSTDYDRECQMWNGQISKKPAIIVKCKDTEDVVKAVEFANHDNLAIAIRSTGHHVAGSSMIDHGMVIDVSEMKAIEIDPEEHIARVQPGVTWGELDHRTQEYGLATPGGVVSDTGVTGLTLGGGYGWLRRAFGLASDNLIEVTCVTGSGKVVTASQSNNEGLFSALQGGSGNFAVVTELCFQLHEVGPELFMGITFYKYDKKVLQAYLDQCHDIANEITSMALLGWVPEEPDFPEEHHGKPTIIILSVHSGNPRQGQNEIVPLRQLGEIYVDFSDIMRYTDIQQFFDADYPRGMNYYWSSIYLDEIDDELLTLLMDEALKSPSQLTTVDIWHLGGKISEKDRGVIEYRDAKFLLGIESNWTDTSDSDQNIRWNKSLKRKIKQKTLREGYVNFSSGVSGSHATEEHYPNFYLELIEIKRRYDPNGLFTTNLKIDSPELAN